MSVKKFKFVSPGVFINEIDNSFIPREEGPLGPVIIGRSERGPALKPVRVNSFSEFIDIFGYPIPGGKGDDVARDGNYIGPTYGPFAAQAYLRSAVGPCTFVRLLGAQHTDATTAGKATKPDPAAGPAAVFCHPAPASICGPTAAGRTTAGATTIWWQVNT